MGLFGPGPSYSRFDNGPDGVAASNAVEEIARRIESDLQDTPGEYLVLQAAGMLFACEHRAVERNTPVRTLDESFHEATRIMSAFRERPTTPVSTMKQKAKEVHGSFTCAHHKGIRPALLVAFLNHYLHTLDTEHLTRTAQLTGMPPSDRRARSWNELMSVVTQDFRRRPRSASIALGCLALLACGILWAMYKLCVWLF